jgi:dihydropteroate synthase
MHIQGTPQTMQQNPHYENVTKEVMDFFVERIQKLTSLGVNDIIIDVGFGFGKNIEHNYELLNHLDLFRMFEKPVLVGLSRKSMVNKVLGVKAEDALNGTSVLNTIALMKGANILRVHDVREATEAIRLTQMIDVNKSVLS